MAKKEEVKTVKDIDPIVARMQLFNKQLEELQLKSGFKLYAVNQAFEGGEVIPVVKIHDTLAIKGKKVDENITKAGDITNKETQTDSEQS